MTIYSPEEDSYLLQEALEKINFEKELTILDMGAGSGIQAKTMLQKGILPKNIYLSDINSRATSKLKKEFPGARVINSDLFEKIEESFDVIIFNPPYLPEDKKEPKNSKIATTGGKFGGELISVFLRQAKKHLKDKGKIFLLISSHTKKIDWNGFRKKIILKKKIFFEELIVLELTKR
jgi:release factor glutamine methyltransferase